MSTAQRQITSDPVAGLIIAGREALAELRRLQCQHVGGDEMAIVANKLGSALAMADRATGNDAFDALRPVLDSYVLAVEGVSPALPDDLQQAQEWAWQIEANGGGMVGEVLSILIARIAEQGRRLDELSAPAVTG